MHSAWTAGTVPTRTITITKVSMRECDQLMLIMKLND